MSEKSLATLIQYPDYWKKFQKDDWENPKGEPVQTYVSQRGSITGGVAKLMQAACERSKANFNIFAQNADKLIRELDSQNDLICYADIERKQAVPFWNGYLYMGMLATIQGDPGCGKTFLVTDLAAGVTRGILPPDYNNVRQKTEPGNVLFINGEDSPEHTIAPRLDKAEADSKRVFTLRTDKDPLDFSQILRLEKAIQQSHPLLVVFDPIQQFLGPGVDMHRANEVRPVLARIKDLAAKHNFACIFVMHMNKYGGGKAQYRGLGSIDISAIMRAQLLVGEDRRTPGARLIIPIKNSLGMLQPAQGFTISDSGVTWTGVDTTATEQDILLEANNAKEGSALKGATDWLLEKLEKTPYWSKDLDTAAEAEGISKRTIERARADLRENWKIINKKAPGLQRWYWAMNHREVAFTGNGEITYDNQQ